MNLSVKHFVKADLDIFNNMDFSASISYCLALYDLTI